MRERFGLYSESAIARVMPAMPAPMMAILKGGEEEAMFARRGITLNHGSRRLLMKIGRRDERMDFVGRIGSNP